MKSLLILAMAACPLPALAEVTAKFIEGAPKDRFVVTNGAGCAFGQTTIEVNLQGSSGALIFDTTAEGAGVEVFQPLDVITGLELLSSVPDVKDGDQSLVFQLTGLAPGAAVSFTIDVDDTIGQREITVTDAEIAGATFHFGDQTGLFGKDAVASIDATGCTS